MKVHWTDTAEGHLGGIYAYIAQDSPEYAIMIGPFDYARNRSDQHHRQG